MLCRRSDDEDGEFGLWAAFAGGLPDNACDAAAEA
jgi:hypothetical protein